MLKLNSLCKLRTFPEEYLAATNFSPLTFGEPSITIPCETDNKKTLTR